MPRSSLALLLWLVAGPALCRAELQPHYAAEMVGAGVDVRSGPGCGYYATMKLQPGAEVEVYRHDPGGWCAIRPPAGSFSWVSGDFLRPAENDLAEVIGRRVCARVGSSFSDIRDVIQLRLDQGDVQVAAQVSERKKRRSPAARFTQLREESTCRARQTA